MAPRIIDIRPQHVNHTDNQSLRLFDTIVSSLQREHKSMPQMVLYDDHGLGLFERITDTPEYYLTRAEIGLLQQHAQDIASTIQSNAVVVELGAGSLRKTRLLLDAIDKSCTNIEYYALDVALESLHASLQPLEGQYNNIVCKGLHGTYDDAFTFLGHLGKDRQRVVLWLGSSIGNDDKQAARQFVNELKSKALAPGDVLIIGVDRQSKPETTLAAYNDAQGITREFYLNGMEHANAILVAHEQHAQMVLDKSKFEYVGVYNEQQGRHEAYYESKQDQYLPHPVDVHISQGERILIEYSCKYTLQEIADLANHCGLHWIRHYKEQEERYGLHVFQVPSSLFLLSKDSYDLYP